MYQIAFQKKVSNKSSVLIRGHITLTYGIHIGKQLLLFLSETLSFIYLY